HGEHLVILRRGRLFTVRVGDRDLKPVSAIDAFAPDIDPRGAWYDEMLISGNTVVVIGYSYSRGGTEIGLFEVSPAGALRYKATWHLRSNDYYSSRNYASRLIGSKLVFYTPLYLNPWSGTPHAMLPAVRKWRSGATPEEFKRIAPATRIYRTDEPLDPFQGVALHTVTSCDLAQPELDCQSTAVLGQPGRVFYVSPNSVFVWTTAWNRRGEQPNVASGVFRMPLDGTAPSALKVAGSPVDQFSFLEGEDGFLNVLVRSNGRGDGMWSAEVNSGDLALMRVHLSRFSDGRDSAPAGSYRPLPQPSGGQATQNRFIGEYLLYGAGAGWRRPQSTPQSELFAVRYAAGYVYGLPLVHGVDRIEALGANAVVVGTDGKDLHFTSVRLSGYPLVRDRYTRPNAAQGETRSHGFFYKPENEQEGLVGLPIIGRGQPASRHLRHESASLLYLRNTSLSFSELGTLDSRPGNTNDGCRASCVDWYGNSRPLFVQKRVFALMGYEIVEGRVQENRIAEVRRINYAPQSGDYAMISK
ncbi:MAG TPA: beta-propeller domain-containing protein, partial [Burkholderiales bacterium]|nr:beta-propeller domain-containing protein [Burkholderiales bacterium]